MYDICVVTGTRAEYGLLRPLLFRLNKSELVDLKLVVTGSHLSKNFGNTQDEIIADGFSIYKKLFIPLDDDSKLGMTISASVEMQCAAELFSTYTPDAVVLLGDRYEILSVALAAFFSGVPVVHISGGDITEGAVDNVIRHCLTKISSLHFPGCMDSAKRIIQMGEQPNIVFNVGELGVENCLKTKLMSRQELSTNLGVQFINGNYSVVTFHPVTMEEDTAEEQVCELIKAMNSFEDMSYIITLANADYGGRGINNIWRQEKEKHSNWLVISSLGVVRYLTAVKHAKLVIGNSSSGIVEAPSLGTPTINIGDRQKGRMMAESVICCAPHCEDIVNAMRKGVEADFQKMSLHVKSPFGDGTTSEQIMEKILAFLSDNNKTREKHFYDIDFSI